jgi:hypothetical protein
MVEKKTGLDWVLDILNTALLILIGLACIRFGMLSVLPSVMPMNFCGMILSCCLNP